MNTQTKQQTNNFWLSRYYKKMLQKRIHEVNGTIPDSFKRALQGKP